MRGERFYIGLLLLCSLAAFGQPDSSRRFRNIEVGLLLRPGHSFRILDYRAPNGALAAERDALELPGWSSEGGLHLGWALSERLQLQAGLLLASRRIQTRTQALDWAGPDPAYPITARIKYHFRYTEIPLSLRYRLFGGRLSGIVFAGPSFQLFRARKTSLLTELPDGSRQVHNSRMQAGYRKLNVAAAGGLELRYALTEQLSLSVGPYAMRFLDSIVLGRDAREYLYSLGLGLGAQLRLAKKESRPRALH